MAKHKAYPAKHLRWLRRALADQLITGVKGRAVGGQASMKLMLSRGTFCRCAAAAITRRTKLYTMTMDLELRRQANRLLCRILAQY